ncbi:signal recognition particle-docking protein FtsY [bacterium]|nr:signal recognition particle-docking protein FtsY [bacterium]
MGLFDLFKKKKESERAEDEQRMDRGLDKTRENLLGRMARMLVGKSKVDADVLDELESVLIEADLGVETTVRVIRKLEENVARDPYLKPSELEGHMRKAVLELMEPKSEEPNTVPPTGLKVILVVGVNGVGKTTTIGKLGLRFQQQGLKVMLAAADTFRAAAIDQLKVWADRSGVDFVAQSMGSDPAAVAHEALQRALSSESDVLLIDTAGRLHNKVNLMQELSKIRRVLEKLLPGAPHEVLLVLDASTGQNALEQARQFTAATQVTGLVLTKLDGTAKGGVVVAIASEFQLPVRFVGLGEGIEDLQVFDAQIFVNSLFKTV